MSHSKRLTAIFAVLALVASVPAFCSATAAKDSSPGSQITGSQITGSQIPGSQKFSLEQAKRFHQQFEPPFGTWALGGDFTRFVYLHMAEFWPHVTIHSTGHSSENPRALPLEPRESVANFNATTDAGKIAVREYVRNSPTDAVIVLHQGRIVFEDYPRMLATDKHIWFSVSKTLVSTAVAILEDRGQVDAHLPIETYLPSLSGTAWAGVPVIDLLDMASGIDCQEIKQDPNGCFWKFYDGFGWPMADRAIADPMTRVRQMGRLRPSGEAFDYTSVNTEVLNWLIEAVSGERYGDFIEREIWQPAGAAADALITTTSNGDAFSAGGVSSNLRDLARFGMLFTPAGRSGSTPVISDAYLNKIQHGGRPELASPKQQASRQALIGDNSPHHNTYQWDIVTNDGDFYKAGVGSQGLYVSPSRDLVIAWFATPTGQGEMTEMPQIARELAISGLFKTK